MRTITVKKGTGEGEKYTAGWHEVSISTALDGPENTVVLKVNDSPEELVGKSLNVFLYQDGDYKRPLGQFAPITFEGKADTFKEDDVNYWKSKAEKYYTEYIKPKTKTANGVKEAEEVFGTDPF